MTGRTVNPAESREPTAQDIANAARRAEIAARQAAEYLDVKALALCALGPGWTPWMKLSLIDSDHRKNGNTEPAAIAYKVYRGDARVSDQAVYLRQMPDGSVRHAESYEPLFGELLTEKHPTRTLEIRGEAVPADRYELHWSALALYAPKSAEQLAAARAKREELATARLAAANPLFADEIQATSAKPERKGPRR